MSSTKIEIHGYAIVTDDDRIAGPDGRTPPALRNDADWRYFQGELDRAEVTALGRLGHEANPNARRRRRLVLSHGAHGIETRSDALWWNPAERPWSTIATGLLPTGGRVATPGGQRVFDLFLDVGYDAFHLTRAHGVVAPGGRAIFARCDEGWRAEDVLASAQLVASESRMLDPAANVSLTIWRKAV
jgi:hypothetical protein